MSDLHGIELHAFGATWNNREMMKLKDKKKLLSEAGHVPNAFAYRAWEGIPLRVKHDVFYVYNRNQSKGVQNVDARP